MSQETPIWKRKPWLIGGIAVGVVGLAAAYFLRSSKPAQKTAPLSAKEQAIASVIDQSFNTLDEKELGILYSTYSKLQLNYGKLDRACFARIFRSIGIDDAVVVNSYFRAFDSNKDEVIDFEELVHALSILGRGMKADQARLAFSIYDVDGDGVITVNELTRIYRALHAANHVARGESTHLSAAELKQVDQEVAELINAVDTNNDDRISCKELIHAMSAYEWDNNIADSLYRAFGLPALIKKRNRKH
eukprot:TRINITY_DN1434_c0_g1_i3.p1 TRINITY_DN1434_c0_g1~~TRINITY_DN1434_c0_g1_i3.p1  ORF type:complete len:268 (-),score=77.92 TRINITY_DN1434_c0_g1_i3:212-952(-)